MKSTNKQNLKDQMTMQGEMTVRVYDSITGELKREYPPVENIVVSSNTYGKNIVARQLIGDTTYPLEIDSAKIGDDNTTPAVGDTDLGNALLSGISVTQSSVSNNVITLDFFITDAQLSDDTYEEFGLFMNGRILTRVLFSPSYTKATNEDTRITYTLTV